MSKQFAPIGGFAPITPAPSGFAPIGGFQPQQVPSGFQQQPSGFQPQQVPSGFQQQPSGFQQQQPSFGQKSQVKKEETKYTSDPKLVEMLKELKLSTKKQDDILKEMTKITEKHEVAIATIANAIASIANANNNQTQNMMALCQHLIPALDKLSSIQQKGINQEDIDLMIENANSKISGEVRIIFGDDSGIDQEKKDKILELVNEILENPAIVTSLPEIFKQ